jgi:hypothetical protein
MNRSAFYVAHATLNPVSDLGILALPIPIIARTSMDHRQKIIVLILFGTGSL